MLKYFLYSSPKDKEQIITEVMTCSKYNLKKIIQHFHMLLCFSKNSKHNARTQGILQGGTEPNL